MIQLNPPLPVITSRGKGVAHFLIDYGYEHHLTWVVFLDASGECWSFKNTDIRIQSNITHGRTHISPFYNPNEVAFKRESSTYAED